MAFRSSNKEYDEKLFEREIDCLRIGDYINARTPILHQGFCGHEWMANPDNILRGKGCPRCNGGSLKTTEIYKQELVQKGIDLIAIDEYVNDATPIMHECRNKHQWKARPTHILQGTNCPHCGYGGFDFSKPAILYYIKFIRNSEIYYKIGITNRTIEQRFSREKDKEIKVLKIEKFLTGKEAWDKEQELLHSLPNRVTVKNFLKSSGNTELFNIDILQLDTRV